METPSSSAPSPVILCLPSGCICHPKAAPGVSATPRCHPSGSAGPERPIPIHCPRVPGSVPESWILHQQLLKAKLEPPWGAHHDFLSPPSPKSSPGPDPQGEETWAEGNGCDYRRHAHGAWGLAAAPRAQPGHYLSLSVPSINGKTSSCCCQLAAAPRGRRLPFPPPAGCPAGGWRVTPMPPGRSRHRCHQGEPGAGWVAAAGWLSRCVSRCLRLPQARQSLLLSPPWQWLLVLFHPRRALITADKICSLSLGVRAAMPRLCGMRSPAAAAQCQEASRRARASQSLRHIPGGCRCGEAGAGLWHT